METKNKSQKRFKKNIAEKGVGYQAWGDILRGENIPHVGGTKAEIDLNSCKHTHTSVHV